MQEFNRSSEETFSKSSAEQVGEVESASASISPPVLFPTPVVQNKKSTSIDGENEEQSTEKGSLEFTSGGPLSPPDLPTSRSRFLNSSTSIQRRKEAEGGHESSPKNGSSGSVMQKMEQSLGANFADVKIHSNSSSAKDAGALAYTQGSDIHFAPGQYNPESTSGQELLGHELTHVVQQREGRVKPTGQVNGKALNDDPGLENEADLGGKKAAQGIVQKKEDPSSSTATRHVSFPLQTSPMQRKKAGEDTTPVDVDEEAIARELISNGARNENYVTDEVFYMRYPGIHRRKLVFPKSTDAEMVLIRDWLRIRNEVVRPILAGEKEKPKKDKPDKDKPKKGDPKNGKPKKEKPKEEKPKKEKPKKDEPKKDEPKKDVPKTPGLDSLIPDLLGITPETFNSSLDDAKAFFELCRLIPIAGIFAGMISGSIQMYQDLMTSIQTGDWFLVLATFGRNAVNLLNGIVSDIGWLITCLQDLGAAITAASTSGGPLVALVGLCEAFIAFCNEVVTLINFLLDLLMLFLDTLVVVHTTLKLSLAPMTEDERAAHKSLLVGYIGNGAADLISTFLDGLDLASLGLLHGEFIDKILKAWKGMSFVKKFGTAALAKLTEILAGIIIPGEVNVAQAKTEGEEMEEEGDGLEEILSTFVLANQKFESLDGGAKALLDMWPTFLEQMEAKIAEMSDGREPFEVAQEMFDQALAEMEGKITSMTFIQDQLESADSNILIALEEIERVESMIEEISIPEIEGPDIDLGDNPIADGLEGVLEDGAGLVVETINKAIRLANQELEEIKVSLRSGIADFKEELEYVRLVIQESQKVLSAHKEELRNFIDSTREQLAACGSFEDLFDKLLGEIGKVLGIDEEIDIETLRKEWDSTKIAVAEGLKTIQDLLSGKAADSSDATQFKVKQDGDDSKSNTSADHIVQKKEDEAGPFQRQAGSGSEAENSIENGLAFQMKKEVPSGKRNDSISEPFQLKTNEMTAPTSTKKEDLVPFAF